MYAIASCVKWSEPVFDTGADRPGEWELLLRLGGRRSRHAGARRRRARDGRPLHSGLIATMCATAGTPLTGRDAGAAFAALPGHGPERLVDLGIRLGPWGDDLGRRPGGLDPRRGQASSGRSAVGRLGGRPPRGRRDDAVGMHRVDPPAHRGRHPAARSARWIARPCGWCSPADGIFDPTIPGCTTCRH